MKKDIKVFRARGVSIGEGATKICMPLVGQTEDELMAGAGEALTLKPDVVEWRADYFHRAEDPKALRTMLSMLREAIALPLLFTCRDVSEGGFAKIGLPARAALIEEVVASGEIDLVDIELAAVKNGLGYLIQTAKKKGVGVVLSNHFFTKTPSAAEIVSILCEEQSYGADIAKIAVMPNSPSDVLSLLEATDKMHSELAEIPLITMSMGHLGLVSRICGGVFGSALTFGAGRNTSAPGQIGIAELRKSLEPFFPK